MLELEIIAVAETPPINVRLPVFTFSSLEIGADQISRLHGPRSLLDRVLRAKPRREGRRCRRRPSSGLTDQLLSACMTSPNKSQLSPLKRASWTAWIG